MSGFSISSPHHNGLYSESDCIVTSEQSACGDGIGNTYPDRNGGATHVEVDPRDPLRGGQAYSFGVHSPYWNVARGDAGDYIESAGVAHWGYGSLFPAAPAATPST